MSPRLEEVVRVGLLTAQEHEVVLGLLGPRRRQLIEEPRVHRRLVAADSGPGDDLPRLFVDDVDPLRPVPELPVLVFAVLGDDPLAVLVECGVDSHVSRGQSSVALGQQVV